MKTGTIVQQLNGSKSFMCKFLTTREFANLFNYSIDSARALVRNGKLTKYEEDGRFMIDPREAIIYVLNCSKGKISKDSPIKQQNFAVAIDGKLQVEKKRSKK